MITCFYSPLTPEFNLFQTDLYRRPWGWLSHSPYSSLRLLAEEQRLWAQPTLPSRRTTELLTWHWKQTIPKPTTQQQNKPGRKFREFESSRAFHRRAHRHCLPSAPKTRFTPPHTPQPPPLRVVPSPSPPRYQFSIISLMAFAGLWMTSPAAMRFTTASSRRRMTPAMTVVTGARLGQLPGGKGESRETGRRSCRGGWGKRGGGGREERPPGPTAAAGAKPPLARLLERAALRLGDASAHRTSFLPSRGKNKRARRTGRRLLAGGGWGRGGRPRDPAAVGWAAAGAERCRGAGAGKSAPPGDKVVVRRAGLRRAWRRASSGVGVAVRDGSVPRAGRLWEGRALRPRCGGSGG